MIWSHEKPEECGSLENWIASVYRYLRVARLTGQDIMDAVFGRLAPATQEALNSHPPAADDFATDQEALDDLFRRMKACFAGEGQTTDAIHKWESARQKETESPEMWRFRLESTARKAFGPGLSPRLILDKYINGLVHPRLVAAVGEKFPETLSDAVMYARNIVTLVIRQQRTYSSTEPEYLRKIMQIYSMKPIPKSGDGSARNRALKEGTLGQMQAAAKPTGRQKGNCWNCDQPGHHKRDCPHPKRINGGSTTQRQPAASGPRPKGPKNNKGPHGRGQQLGKWGTVGQVTGGPEAEGEGADTEMEAGNEAATA